jgi:hypothetical protein
MAKMAHYAFGSNAPYGLLTIERLNPDFVNATIADLAIKDPFKPIAGTALEDAKALLRLL